ncbi:hypothetical protein UA45_18505, partial [Morganella morganii]
VERLPGWAVTFTPQNGKGSALATLTQSHRQLTIPVIGRVSDGRCGGICVVLKMKTDFYRHCYHDFCYSRPC